MIFKAICLFCIIILAFVAYNLIQNNQVNFKETTRPEVNEFSTEFRFTRNNNSIDVDAKYECTTLDLRECDVDDQTSCAGCKSFNATCTHFDVDTPFIDSDGVEVIVPKNIDSSKGYCLNVTSLSDGCSPQGDYAIIQNGVDTYDFYLICVCKNPGLIGNLELNGNCSTVYMCNGKIDDINKPIQDIKCICGTYQIQDVRNGIPYCRDKKFEELTAEDLNNLNKLEPEVKFLSLDYFDKTIVQNLPANIKLRDPCSVCPITGERIEAEAVKDSYDNVYCRETSPLTATNVVIIASESDNGRILNGAIGGNVALGLKWENVLVIIGQDSYFRAFYVCSLASNPKYKTLFGSEKYIYVEAPRKGIPNIHYLYNFIRDFSSGPSYWWDTFNYSIDINHYDTNKKTATSGLNTNKFNIAFTVYYQYKCPMPWGCGPWNEFNSKTVQIAMTTDFAFPFQPFEWDKSGKLLTCGLYNIYSNGKIGMIGFNGLLQKNWIKLRNIYDPSKYGFSTEEIASW